MDSSTIVVDSIVRLFKNKFCCDCGKQAERLLSRKPFCQKCFLLRTVNNSSNKSSAIKELPHPFPNEVQNDRQEMSVFIFHEK